MTAPKMPSEEIERLRQRRIGVTTGLGTGICSMVAVFVSNPIVVLASDSLVPTEDELALLVSFLEYRTKKFFGAATFNRPGIPVAEGANTTVFIKGPGWWPNGEESWAYRRMTWISGPTFVPWSRDDTHDKLGLLELIDTQIETMGGKVSKAWVEWKRERSLGKEATA